MTYSPGHATDEPWPRLGEYAMVIHGYPRSSMVIHGHAMVSSNHGHATVNHGNAMVTHKNAMVARGNPYGVVIHAHTHE